MSEQLNFLDHYPNKPGWKGKRTSQRAASDVKQGARLIREAVEAWFRAGNVGNPEECARAIGYEKHTVRSRISELAAANVLEDSGTTSTKTATGKPATVWRIRP